MQKKDRSAFSFDSYELKPWRKMLHMSSAWTGFVYLYSGIVHQHFILLIGGLTALLLLLDLLRYHSAASEKLLQRMLGALFIHRDYKRLSSASWYMLGVLLCAVLFGGEDPAARMRVTLVIWYLAFGDTAAAVIGKKFGRKKLPRLHGTYVGFAACWAACILVNAAYVLLDNTPALSPVAVFAAPFFAALGEALPAGFLDDNITMVILAALSLLVFA